MTFAAKLLPLLRCSACARSFEFESKPCPTVARGEFGILRCGCTEFPVVDGVPILLRAGVGMFEYTRGTTQVESGALAELVHLVASGKGREALVRCLLPAKRSGIPSVQAWRSRRDLVSLLTRRDSVTAREVLGFLFGHESLGADTGDYFVHRFGQPRFLAALAVVSALQPDAKPLLDVACGAGHLDHYLTKRARSLPVVGLDMNFYNTWIAQHWIAPSAQYVCCNVGDGLPFRDEAFSGVIVSDAYHYLPNRDAFNQEVRRIAPERTVLLTRVGNRDVMPNEGSESSLAGYLQELGAGGARIFSEGALVREYLERRNPFTTPAEPDEVLRRSKWLTYVVNVPDDAAVARPRDEPWPHSVGRLGINPIYDRELIKAGTRLTFRFPATWFAYENHLMLEYHPRRCVLAPADLALLESGGWNDTLEQWLRQFILIGMPERY